jgi:hypothetical protein
MNTLSPASCASEHIASIASTRVAAHASADARHELSMPSSGCFMLIIYLLNPYIIFVYNLESHRRIRIYIAHRVHDIH